MALVLTWGGSSALAAQDEENSIFMFGLSRTLGDPMEANSDPKAINCVKKITRRVAFCLETTLWPEDVAPLLDVRDAALFRGTQSVTVYQPPRRNGADDTSDYVATRYFQPFDPGNFDGVTAFLAEMLGPPANDWTRLLRRPGEGELENRVVRWQIIHGEDDARTIFEVRRLDTNVMSVYGSPLASLHLYIEGAKTIFPGMRTADLAILSARFLRARSTISPTATRKKK